MRKISATAQNSQDAARKNDGKFGHQQHAAPEVTLKAASPSKGVTTTVTLPDGTVAQRTSKNGNYTHAVVLSPEVPELVVARARQQIAQHTTSIELLNAALDDPRIKIRNRNFTRGSDPDVGYDGKPSYSGYEVLMYAPGSDEVLVRSWSNSKGMVKSTAAWDGETNQLDLDFEKPQGAKDHLLASARSNLHTIKGYRSKAEETIAAVEDGSYDLGGYGVVRWSSREDLAVKAARSEFPVTSSTRHSSVVPVD